MSDWGLSHLLASIMAAGDVAVLPVCELRLAHAALVELNPDESPDAAAVLRQFDVRVRTTPDPAVGLRVAGLTRSLVDAIREGLLVAHEDGADAWYAMPQEQRHRLRMRLDRMDRNQSRLLYELGTAWARASTSRKYRPSDASTASRSLVSAR